MKKITLILVFFCIASGTIALDAATLHSVIVADTTDESIGDSTAVDLSMMRKETVKIAHYTGLRLRETILQGRYVEPHALLKVIDKLKVKSDDVVVFYFSGHGFRSESKGDNPWPNLYFSLKGEGVDLTLVKEKLEEKNPRFILAIADVCNSEIPDLLSPPLVFKMFRYSNDEEVMKANYRTLFLETEGTLIVSSSEVGEFSWGTSSGGLFTLAFLQSLDSAIRSSEYPNWEAILTRAYELVSEDQHPQWELITGN